MKCRIVCSVHNLIKHSAINPDELNDRLEGTASSRHLVISEVLLFEEGIMHVSGVFMSVDLCL